jgi:hypothetical protein
MVFPVPQYPSRPLRAIEGIVKGRLSVGSAGGMKQWPHQGYRTRFSQAAPVLPQANPLKPGGLC